MSIILVFIEKLFIHDRSRGCVIKHAYCLGVLCTVKYNRIIINYNKNGNGYLKQEVLRITFSMHTGLRVTVTV